MLNRAAVFELALKADTPPAAAFREWVCEEVLPAIDETGGVRRRPATAGKRGVTALRLDCIFPAGVRGPVDLPAFTRLAVSRRVDHRVPFETIRPNEPTRMAPA